MKIKALTSEGTWWLIRDAGYEGVLDKDEFFERWLQISPDSFFQTSETDTYIQKCNIVAIEFEE